MQAWQYVGEGQPITLNEVAEPVALSDEVVVDVKAAGLCHSDVGFLDGTMTGLLGYAPITLGHEIAGVISEVGSAVSAYSVGDRVALRSDLTGPGCGRHGGFQARVATQTDFLVRVPEAVSWDQAAVSTDAGGTAYHAVTTRGMVQAGHKVGIIGFGGLGSLGAQIARRAGAEIYVAETNLALHPVIRSSNVAAVATNIAEFASERLDVIIDFAGFGTTTASAVETVRHGGRVVQVGLAAATGTINLLTLTVNEVELVGSLGGTNDENVEVLSLMASGDLLSETTIIRFEQIGDALAKLAEGGTRGRFVVSYD
jgi:2-desacetyl-2-hydroxyethyl bacteriochlorophyllide A dehydrogenase